MCKRNRDGGFATQAERHKILQLSANQLHELGHRHLGVHGLRLKHVLALVDRWKSESISTGAMKNRMVHLRWWAEKIGKPEIIPKKNSALNIPNRVYVAVVDKGVSLDGEILSKITDPYTRVSLQLQAAFGLRREEAMKFQPSWADRGDKIVLKDSWCKGSKEREILIRNEEQRAALKLAHQLAGKGSLIPPDKKYIQQVKIFERQCKQAGLHGSHGLRHRFAQDLYKEKTGWDCPVRGGPKSNELSKEQRQLDRQARLEISVALGHERRQVTTSYLGSSKPS
jgi:integrase